jgi:outer membrane protein OmpA-like peptidoglycan-associated protein
VADSTADRSRRPAWLPLVGAAIVVPTVLAGLTQLWPRPQIEDQLTRTGSEALATAGFPGAGLVMDGRDATISGIDPADNQRAIDIVQGVSGVRIATVPDAGAGIRTGATTVAPAPAPAPTVEAEPFGIARRGEDIVLSGVVGSAEERTRLIAAATTRAGGRNVVDELTVSAGAVLPAGVSQTAIEAAAAALTGAVGGDTAISISDSGVQLTGTVADDAARDTAEQAVAAALPGIEVDNQLVVGPAAAGTGAGGATGPAELDATTKQQLQGSLSQLLAGAPITFEPNSPTLTAQGNATVARVLELVRAAPGARLQIDGFVATGPSNGQLTAQQLSDQRAAAVRDALTAGGVPADSIVARGLGEGTSPAAAGSGRRVDITVI